MNWMSGRWGKTCTMLAMAAVGVPALRVSAQMTFLLDQPAEVAEVAVPSAVTLPEAPSAVLQQQEEALPPSAARDTHRSGPYAPPYTKYIPAGYVTSRQTVREKEITGARDLYSFGNIASMFISSGWEHLTNGQPSFGTDKGAYGQRLGAAVIRDTTEGIYTDMIFSPLLHQDLRYYVKGPQHSVARRSLYALSRVFVARRDSHSTTINTAQLLGYAATTATEQLYYPQSNRNWHDALTRYGGSIGGAVLANVFSEFQDDLMKMAHVKKKWRVAVDQ